MRAGVESLKAACIEVLTASARSKNVVATMAEAASRCNGPGLAGCAAPKHGGSHAGLTPEGVSAMASPKQVRNRLTGRRRGHTQTKQFGLF
eukprot:3857911-Prymnesium_polylepis.1